MAYFEPYSPIIDKVSGREQLVEIEEEEAPQVKVQVQVLPEGTTQIINKVFHHSISINRRKTLVRCVVIAGVFALASFIVFCYLISNFHNHQSTDNFDFNSKARTAGNEYFGLDGRSCRIINVENPELVVNVHGGLMHDGSLAILYDKSELNWNSKWRAIATRGGVRFEVTSPTGVMKVLQEDAETHAVILSASEESTQSSSTSASPPPSNQIWILMQQPSGTVRIKNQKSKLYLRSNGKLNQLTTTTEYECMEDKTCLWDIAIIDMIWNKERNSLTGCSVL